MAIGILTSSAVVAAAIYGIAFALVEVVGVQS
jgi:hypothetical protein